MVVSQTQPQEMTNTVHICKFPLNGKLILRADTLKLITKNCELGIPER